jgi:hypothetical protein
MAAIDPADMRIQVRLADLYRAANHKDEAVMQYGLIGSMLLKRGAHDEAAQVFQKALELSPDDIESQKNLVRSLLAQNNAEAAMAVLKAAPRTAESLALFAEAQLEMGQRAERRTAEQALIDADAGRRAYSRLLPVQEGVDRASPRSPRRQRRPSGGTGAARRRAPRAVLAADPNVATLEMPEDGDHSSSFFARMSRWETAENGRTRDPRALPEGAEPTRQRRGGAAMGTSVRAGGTSLNRRLGRGYRKRAGYQGCDRPRSGLDHAPQPKVPSIDFGVPPSGGSGASPGRMNPAAGVAAPSTSQQIGRHRGPGLRQYGLVDKAIDAVLAGSPPSGPARARDRSWSCSESEPGPRARRSLAPHRGQRPGRRIARLGPARRAPGPRCRSAAVVSPMESIRGSTSAPPRLRRPASPLPETRSSSAGPAAATPLQR